LHVDQEYSNKITARIDSGDLSEKPGWVRLSLHPVMTLEDVHFIADAIEQIALHPERWMDQYRYSSHTNEYHPLQENDELKRQLSQWFNLEND